MSMNGEGLAYWSLKLQAMSWLVIGRSVQAGQVFDAMYARWPQDAYTLASRAHLYAQRGDHRAAIADARALVTLHPQRSAADWFNLGFMLDETGDLGDAEAAFKQALVLDPKLDRAWYGLALTLIRQKRFDEAVPALKRNTELQPMSPYGWYQLARVHMDRQEPDEARRIIAHLRRFEPKVAAQLEREARLQG